MSITQEEIKKISKNLAKLNPKNEEKLLSSMTSILDYFEELNEVHTDWVEPTVSPITKWHNKLREDNVEKEIKSMDLLNCSKQKIIANQIAIPDIMK